MNAETEAVKSQETAPEIKEQADTQVKQEETNLKFGQDDLEKIVKDRIAREKAKYEKKYSGVDVDHYKQLVEAEEKRRHGELEKRGEFEKLLKEQAEKFNSKIGQYENELQSIKIDGALLNEAATAKAINPNQVTQLLKAQLKLNEAGQVDVIDPSNGQVKYNDNGDPFSVKDLVNNFLNANKHFVQAGPSGSGTGQGFGKQDPVVDNDTSKLNMMNPDHRARYKEIMKKKGVRL
jgi:hypothetical protein